MKDFVIEKAAAADLSAIAAAEKICFSDPWSENALAETLASPAAVFLAAREAGEGTGGALLGYGIIYCLPGEGEILNLAVLPEARRRGIGRALLSALIDEGKRRAALVFYLDVRRSNSAAIALYEGQGFVPVGLRKRYYTHPAEDAVEMQMLVKKE